MTKFYRKNPRHRISVLLIGLPILLAACANQRPPCDYNFRDQQFVSIATSAASGEYQRCTEHLRSELIDLRVEVERSKREAERLERLSENSSSDVGRAQRDLAELNRELDDMVSTLEQARASKDTDQQKLNEVIKQQRALQSEIDATNKSAKSGDNAQLAQRVAALRKRRERLIAQRKEAIGA